MNKREAKFQTKFNRWMRLHHKKTCAFELKVALDHHIYFRQVRDHQKAWLLAAKKGVAVHKLPDDTIGFKPFDGFCLAGVPAWVVPIFENRCYLIDIETWIRCEETSSARSLTEDEIKKIASFEAIL